MLTRSVCPVVIKDLKGEQTMLLFYSLEVVVENIAGVPTHYITCTLHGVMALWNNFFTIDFLSKNKNIFKYCGESLHRTKVRCRGGGSGGLWSLISSSRV